MPAFTKFGIWDKEVRAFIKNMAKEKEISQEALTAWFYDGPAVQEFQAVQAKHTQAHEKRCLERQKLRPLIDMTQILGQKMLGFRALENSLINAFAENDTFIPVVISLSFWSDIMSFDVQDKYMPFYEVQAQIATDLNIFLNENPDVRMSNDEKFTFVKNAFEKKQVEDPQSVLSQQIADHIQFMQEYVDYMKKPQWSVVPSSLFVASSSAESSFQIGAPKM